ncbi:MAG TPA: DegT/DnrJ/EryC1/StrS family aminotransferase [Anaerolineales bacterium]|nr:DegT/DnrJ/EryC1/StrS family aminotransferase [Anaerolineales bacterium]
MRTIPAIDLNRQTQAIRAELDDAIARVLTKGSFILGDEVAAFEDEFAKYCSVAHAVGVASGTDALQIALLACGIGAGDEVIAPSHTAVATIAAIEMTGAKPVLVDIEVTRFGLDPAAVTAVITDQTRCIIPVHHYGCPADLNPILKIARAKKIFVLEDCSQAHGASYRGRKVGGWGDIAAFSFYPTKNLGALGDGGAVVTNDLQLAEKVRLLRQYGWKERYVSHVKGMNSRLDELQAAILRVKLRHLDKWNVRRCEVAALYLELLSGTDLVLPSLPEDSQHVFHQFVVRHPRRDELQAHLRAHGIHTLIHYPVPVHLQPAYANLNPMDGTLSKSERAAHEVLSLPMFPELTEEEARRVSQGIVEFF